MKNIVLFDTSCGSTNMGDYIINESIFREMSPLLKRSFVVKYPTHTPIRRLFQMIRPNKFCSNADYKFLCGTNLFGTNLLCPGTSFNISAFDIGLYRDSISIGCGIGQDRNWAKHTMYSKYIYKHILSREYTHSTRDNKTELFLKNLGFKAINTGCPTMWMLTTEHCAKIPETKSKDVVFTITDYKSDKAADKYLIKTLRNNYRKLFFWVQGSSDLPYLRSICDMSNIEIVYPALDNYRNLLQSLNIDYVGTRLHAGLFALQHCRRSLIIAIDHRARDMNESFNLPIIERSNLDMLETRINSSFATDIKINTENIRKWKDQFML